MEPSTDRLLLLIGSGPGIGRSVASRFVQQHFDRVALIARNAEQLEKDREAVLATAAGVNRAVIVQTWQIDIANTERLEEALGEIEQFGRLECVYFNAARVGTSVLFETPVETIEEDFRVSNLALYATARWAIPLLLHDLPGISDWRPSFLVTSSLFPVEPFPDWFALSMVKAAQANLVKSLERAFASQWIHIGLVVVWGVVSDITPLNPTSIAEQAWNLFAQQREEWTTQVTIYEDGSVNWKNTI